MNKKGNGIMAKPVDNSLNHPGKSDEINTLKK